MDTQEFKEKHKIGDVYIIQNGCPKCGADLEVWHQVAQMCINWQHPNIKESFNIKGNRSCDFALMAG